MSTSTKTASGRAPLTLRVLATAAAAGSLAIGLNAVGAGAAQARNCDIGASACHGQVRAAAASDRIRYP